MNYCTVFVKLKRNKFKSSNRTKFKMTNSAFFIRMILNFKFGFCRMMLVLNAFMRNIITILKVNLKYTIIRTKNVLFVILNLVPLLLLNLLRFSFTKTVQ